MDNAEHIQRLVDQVANTRLYPNETFQILETSLRNQKGLCEIIGTRITYREDDSLKLTPLQYWELGTDRVLEVISQFPLAPVNKKIGYTWFTLYHFVDGEIVGAKELLKQEYDIFREQMTKPSWSRWKES